MIGQQAAHQKEPGQQVALAIKLKIQFLESK
jgi:hypothetical protein